jgi:hypothetical protein
MASAGRTPEGKQKKNAGIRAGVFLCAPFSRKALANATS